MLKYIPLNFGIMAHPLNWVIVLLMIAMAGMGLAVIFTTPSEG